jgi:serine protease inhibitor
MPPENTYYVTLDRPFVYMIVDARTDLPVFMGTVQSLGQ